MYTRVSAAGVAQLRGMKKLEKISVDYTGISREEASKLEEMGVPVH